MKFSTVIAIISSLVVCSATLDVDIVWSDLDQSTQDLIIGKVFIHLSEGLAFEQIGAAVVEELNDKYHNKFFTLAENVKSLPAEIRQNGKSIVLSYSGKVVSFFQVANCNKEQGSLVDILSVAAKSQPVIIEGTPGQFQEFAVQVLTDPEIPKHCSGERQTCFDDLSAQMLTKLKGFVDDRWDYIVSIGIKGDSFITGKLTKTQNSHNYYFSYGDIVFLLRFYETGNALFDNQLSAPQ